MKPVKISSGIGWMVYVQDETGKSVLYTLEFVHVTLRSAVEKRVGIAKVSTNNGTANSLSCIKIKGFTDMSVSK